MRVISGTLFVGINGAQVWEQKVLFPLASPYTDWATPVHNHHVVVALLIAYNTKTVIL